MSGIDYLYVDRVIFYCFIYLLVTLVHYYAFIFNRVYELFISLPFKRNGKIGDWFNFYIYINKYTYNNIHIALYYESMINSDFVIFKNK